MDKKEYIRNMFAGISRRYDLLNSLLSLGKDKYWRRFAVALLPPGNILDVCSGTGDVAIEVSKKSRVVASDFCGEMLQLCLTKIKKHGTGNVYCIQNDAENMPFKDDAFNGTIVAFGIRNVADIRKTLFEMHRVVKQGGKVVILEFSVPENRIFRWIYHLYFQKILPLVGTFVSRKKGAYSYLPSSVSAFPGRDEFVGLMKESGITGIESHALTFGIVTVYAGIKAISTNK